MVPLPLSFYAAFLSTGISIAGWAYLARRKYVPGKPLTLSHLFVSSGRTLAYARAVLWTCGSLFAVTLYLFILPRLHHNPYLFAAWTLAFVCELSLGVFPARGKTEPLHNAAAFVMGFSFLAMAAIFWLVLAGGYSRIELVLIVAMIVLGVLGVVYYKSKFLLYELPFIWLSHISILVAALAVR